jgi:hypothetical protein
MNVVENLLVTLMEECSEVAKCCSKILRAGTEHIPPGRETTNLQELKAELTDMQGTIAELIQNDLQYLLLAEVDIRGMMAKQVKLRHYIAVSRERGCVQGKLAFDEGNTNGR